MATNSLFSLIPPIYESTFAKTDKTDAILVVQEKKLHVNKALLSYHSDYFNTLFNSEFKEKSMEEIEIKDVDFENFATLLSLVQENPLEITKDRVKKLLELADQFLLKGPKCHIEHFIQIAPSFSRFERLQLADKYNLGTLFERTLSQYNDSESFSQFFRSDTWTTFSNEAKLKIANLYFSTDKHLPVSSERNSCSCQNPKRARSSFTAYRN